MKEQQKHKNKKLCLISIHNVQRIETRVFITIIVEKCLLTFKNNRTQQ